MFSARNIVCLSHLSAVNNVDHTTRTRHVHECNDAVWRHAFQPLGRLIDYTTPTNHAKPNTNKFDERIITIQTGWRHH